MLSDADGHETMCGGLSWALHAATTPPVLEATVTWNFHIKILFNFVTSWCIATNKWPISMMLQGVQGLYVRIKNLGMLDPKNNISLPSFCTKPISLCRGNLCWVVDQCWCASVFEENVTISARKYSSDENGLQDLLTHFRLFPVGSGPKYRINMCSDSFGVLYNETRILIQSYTKFAISLLHVSI